MTAIWPAGPPKLRAAIRAHTQNAAPRLTPCLPSFVADTGVSTTTSVWVIRLLLNHFSSITFPAKVFVKILEHGRSAVQAPAVVVRCGRDAGNQRLDARRLLPPELAVLQVDVVDDLGDGLECRFRLAQPGQQDLEGAVIALVRVLGLEHVEA